MYPRDLAFVHLCILLSVWFLLSDRYCTEMEPFSQAVSGSGFQEVAGQRRGVSGNISYCMSIFTHCT